MKPDQHSHRLPRASKVSARDLRGEIVDAAAGPKRLCQHSRIGHQVVRKEIVESAADGVGLQIGVLEEGLVRWGVGRGRGVVSE